MRIAVDTGGTFTDCVILDGSEVRVLKVFSTPENAAQAILEGVRQLAGAARHNAPVEIIHGTTVGTNTLLERRGARVALVTTRGFEDLIEIGRQARPRLYDLSVEREAPLVPRDLRLGARERTGAHGELLLAPTPGELDRLARRLFRAKPESVAICLLFSFANPENERAIARALDVLGVPLSVSHQILPEFREYERLSTVVINAYLAPRMGRYLTLLNRGANGLTNRKSRAAEPEGGRVFVMQSSGGITTAARATREPVRTIFSGPAGGVVAASWLARKLRMPRAISFDMGGTSTDVCLFEGRPRTTRESILAGLPVAVPVLDIHSVGAGGGSLARVDAGGALRVGPESAGSVPGPACYGRGGSRPTVTDANLVLGRLDSDCFLGGAFRLDSGAARESFAAFLSDQRSAGAFKNPVDLARGIVAVSNATMERALRVISVERGHDPRDFALVCFGGAGGLHAASLAMALGLERVVVPRNPGAFSALGIVLSDIIKDVSQSVLMPVPEPTLKPFFDVLGRRLALLQREGELELRREHRRSVSRLLVERWLDVRYHGQAYEIAVPFTPDFPRRFHEEHEKAYGYAHAGRPLEIVNLRLRLILPTAKPDLGPGAKPSSRRTSSGLIKATVKRKPVWFGDRFHETPLYGRDRLLAGTHFDGPAVIVEYSSTTIVPLEFTCTVDPYLNLVLQPRKKVLKP